MFHAAYLYNEYSTFANVVTIIRSKSNLVRVRSGFRLFLVRVRSDFRLFSSGSPDVLRALDI